MNRTADFYVGVADDLKQKLGREPSEAEIDTEVKLRIENLNPDDGLAANLDKLTGQGKKPC